MKIGVVVFPGSNCDHDCFYVSRDVFGYDTEYIWHRDTDVDKFDCIILPGGFSYGDYLRCGAIARFSPVMQAIIEFAGKGRTVIGICNGFQILLESGLLPGAMLRNNTVHFICKYVYIRTENISTRFTGLCQKGQVLKIPVAHNEGNYYIDDAGYKKLKDNDQIVFRYSDREGKVEEQSNINGSRDNIAGIINTEGNVLGMMPHPERSSEKELGSEDGALIFRSMFQWIERNG